MIVIIVIVVIFLIIKFRPLPPPLVSYAWTISIVHHYYKQHFQTNLLHNITHALVLYISTSPSFHFMPKTLCREGQSINLIRSHVPHVRTGSIVTPHNTTDLSSRELLTQLWTDRWTVQTLASCGSRYARYFRCARYIPLLITRGPGIPRCSLFQTMTSSTSLW